MKIKFKKTNHRPKMRPRINIFGSTMYCNFPTWLDLQTKQKIHVEDLIMTVW